MKGKREAFHSSAFVVSEAIADACVKLEVVFCLAGDCKGNESRRRISCKENRLADCPAIIANDRIPHIKACDYSARRVKFQHAANVRRKVCCSAALELKRKRACISRNGNVG